MAKKNLANATKVASMLDSDSLMVEVGGSVRRLPLNNFRDSLNQNDEQILREVAFYIDINEPSSKGATRVDVGGNMGMRELWENAKKSILMDKDGNYCELNPNDCRYTAEGEYVLKDDGSVIDKYAHCDFMVLIPEYYGRVQEVKVSDTKTIQRCWFSLIPLVGGYTIPQQVVGKFKASLVSNNVRSLPNMVPVSNYSVGVFWGMANARSKNLGLADINFRSYLLFHLMSKYANRDVKAATTSDGTIVFGVGLDGSECTLSSGQNAFDVIKNIKTGATLALGNNDGNSAVLDANGGTCHSTNICGIENAWGQYAELIQGAWCLGDYVYYLKSNIFPSSISKENLDNTDHILLTRCEGSGGNIMNVLHEGVFMVPASKNEDINISYNSYYRDLALSTGYAFGGSISASANLASSHTEMAFHGYNIRYSTRLAYYGSVRKVSPQKLATTA